MVKCCIPSCKEEFKSKFSIPKDPEDLRLWEKALILQLKPSSKVCELYVYSFELGIIYV